MRSVLNKISKPHIVDFLRMSDKKRWCLPRIRYASIRSKPELCRDILVKFKVQLKNDLVLFRPLQLSFRFPDRLEYSLQKRVYLVNGEVTDFSVQSRTRPSFSLRKGPVTLHFGSIVGPCSGTIFASW